MKYCIASVVVEVLYRSAGQRKAQHSPKAVVLASLVFSDIMSVGTPRKLTRDELAQHIKQLTEELKLS
jgi:hypothetical protein